MIYFDNAATTGKKPPGVIEAVIKELEFPANPGRSSHSRAINAMNKIYETRELLARLFKSEHPENFILTPNATYALNFAIKGILREGSHVITTVMEHNSVIRPLYSTEGIKITVLKGDRYGFISADELKSAITPETTLIVINHSSNVNGIIQDIDALAEVARSKKIPILVDASQSAGIVDIDSKKFDMIALPGHKGLYGPQGTGSLYVSSEIRLKTIIEGGTGSDSKNVFNPEYIPDRFESGTLNCPGFSGLCEGIKFVLREGPQSIIEKEHYLLTELYGGLSEIKNIKLYSPPDISRLSGLISFNIKDIESQRVSELLNKDFNIATRPGYHCAYPAHLHLGSEESGSVRVSLSYFNNMSEIYEFIYAIKKINNMLY